jgi:DNA helicase-2/ATP-dependent DNA helicase PcrA
LGLSLGARASLGWKEFMSICEDMVRMKSDEPAPLIHAVLNSNYASYLETEYPDYRDRLEDIKQLAVFAERQPDLQRFLADASLQESFANPVSKKNTHDEDQIVLSTIHQAKGLEWEAVFIIHLVNGQFPNDRALKESRGVEEERRLFYVAVTRAKTHLYLTYPLMAGFDTMMQGPSLFLEEVDRNLFDEHRLTGSTVFTDPSDSEDDIRYVAEDEPFASKPRKTGGFLSSVDEL